MEEVRKVVKITITEDMGRIRNVSVTLSHIKNNVDVMTAAIGLIQSMSHGLGVSPKDVAERMVNYFDVEEKNARGVSGGAGAVSQAGEEEK